MTCWILALVTNNYLSTYFLRVIAMQINRPSVRMGETTMPTMKLWCQKARQQLVEAILTSMISMHQATKVNPGVARKGHPGELKLQRAVLSSRRD